MGKAAHTPSTLEMEEVAEEQISTAAGHHSRYCKEDRESKSSIFWIECCRSSSSADQC